MTRGGAARGAYGATVLALLLSACGGAGGDTVVDEALARLAVLRDVVDVRPAEAEPFAAGVLGQDLDGGNQVRTGTPGFAEVSYRDGSLARLDASTTLTVTELATSPDTADVEVDLDAGRVWNRVRDLSESDGRYEVGSSVGVAAVRGTAFDVDCRTPDEAGCIFTVVEGEVAIANDAGQEVVLSPIQQAPVAPDGSIGEVTDFTLDELLASDPWFALNLGLDAERGFPALLGPNGQAPALADDGAPVEPGTLTGDAQVRAASVEVEPSGIVHQHVVVGGPSEITFSWSFCDGLSCGTSENAECVTNKYIPKYAGQFVRGIAIGALPGFRLAEAVLQVGPSPFVTGSIVRVTPDGVEGTSDAFAAPPTIDADGLRLSLRQGGAEETLRFLPDFPGRACGIGEDRRDEILATYGESMSVPAAVVSVDLVWEPESDGAVTALAGQTQTLGISEGETSFTFPELAAPGAEALVDPGLLTPDAGDWSDLLVPVPVAADAVPPTEAPTTPPESFLTGAPVAASVPFREVGAVPTAFAIAFSRLGLDADPGVVGRTMLGRGVWRPGVGTDLAAAGVTGADPVDVTGSLIPPEAKADPAVPVLVRTATARGVLDALEAGDAVPVLGLAGAAGTRNVVVATSYDAASDRVTVIHPTQGQLEVTFAEVLDRLQLAYLVSLPAPPSSARLA